MFSRHTRVSNCFAAFCLSALSILLQVDPAVGQQPAAGPPGSSAARQQSQLTIGNVTFSGSLRLRTENWNWFHTSAADDDYTFGAALLRLSLSQESERVDWKVEGALPALIHLPENSIAPAPRGQLGLGASYFAANGAQDASAFLKQAFVRFKHLGSDRPSTLRIGRFEFIDGAETTPADATLATLKRDHIAHRLIGPFTFSHVGRSFDGAHYSRTSKASNLTAVAARPTEGVFQLRGWSELDVDFYYGAFTKGFPHKRSPSEARVFGLHYHDGRGAAKTDNRTLAARQADGRNIRLTTVGGHYIAAVKAGAGTADLLVWGVGQFGRWGSLDHRAGAIAAEAGYQFPVKANPWIRAGYFRSSGDGSPSDGEHTTFFQVLPTPRVYARFPFYNLMNNQDVFAQLRLKPHARLALRADVRHLRLSNAGDLWYSGGGTFQEQTFGYTGRPSGGKKSLGTLLDLSIDYNPASRTTLSFYASGVRGGGVQSAIHPEAGHNPGGRFLYFEWMQRF
jgi:hypothetical protein